MTDLNVSAVEMLKAAVSQRLTAAAQEIFGLFERTITQYEEELCRSKLENDRQRKLLDAVLKPEVRLHRAVISEDVQQDSEPTYIKEEQEQPWRSQELEVKQLQGPLNSEDDEETAQLSQLHQTETEDDRGAEPAASSSAQHMETECDGEDGGGSKPMRSLDPDSHQAADDPETPNCSEQTDNSGQERRQSRQPQSDVNTMKSKQTQTSVSVSQAGCEDRTSGSFQPKSENIDGLKETRRPQSELKTQTNKGAPAGHKKCNHGKKSCSCSGGKTFKTKDFVQNHTKSPSGNIHCAQFVTHIRSAKKAFGCSICKKQFSFKACAVRHIRTHTGEKPFSCLVCGKTFTQSSGLDTHMRTHTGEKPFSCSLCPKRFIRSGNLVRHMRVHTGEKPYCCSVCNACFSLSQSLLKHMRIHTGEKPFSCSVCHKKFTQKGHLTQHMTLHTGEKSFSCGVCGRKFTRQSRVKKHKCITDSSSN